MLVVVRIGVVVGRISRRIHGEKWSQAGKRSSSEERSGGKREKGIMAWTQEVRKEEKGDTADDILILCEIVM